jgi:hypothetical protein
MIHNLDLNTGNIMASTPPVARDFIAVAANPIKTLVAYDDQSICVWNMGRMRDEPLCEEPRRESDWVTAAALTPDGSRAILAYTAR